MNYTTPKTRNAKLFFCGSLIILLVPFLGLLYSFSVESRVEGLLKNGWKDVVFVAIMIVF